MKRRFDLQERNLFIIYVVRPLSLYLTPLFLLLRISANQATWLGFALGTVGGILLGTSMSCFLKLGAWLSLLCFFFDHIDGNLARYYGKTNHYGKFLDGSTGVIVNSVFYLGLGMGSYRQWQSINIHAFGSISIDPSFFLLAGGIAATASLTNIYMHLRYRNALADVYQVDNQGGEQAKRPKTSGGDQTNLCTGLLHLCKLLKHVARNSLTVEEHIFDTIRFPCLVLAAYTHTLPIYLLVFAVHVSLILILRYGKMLLNAQKSLNSFRPY